MSRDGLHALARLRRLSVDAARRALAESLRAEAEAEAARRAGEAALRAEGDAAASLPVEGGAVGAFAAWLPRGRRVAAVAAAAHAAARDETAHACAALAAAQAGAKVVEALREERARAARQAELRAEQVELDEHRRCPAPGPA